MTKQEADEIIASFQARVKSLYAAARKQCERLDKQCDALGSTWDDEDGWQPCVVCAHYHGKLVCVDGVMVHRARFS